MSGPGGEVTLLLAQLREGSQDAANQLVPLVYRELHRVAGAYKQLERPDHTLQSTALVHEAHWRLTSGESRQWENRTHFFALATHTMRQILVDYARRRSAVSVEETAEVMGVSEIGIKRERRSAKPWLHLELQTRKSG